MISGQARQNLLSRLFLSVVGPTAVIAAGAMGSGSTAALVLAGAWFRYDLLWVVVVTLPSFVIGLDSVSRIGVLAEGTGFLSLIRQRIHPGLTWFLLGLMTVVHLFVAMGQMSVMTSAGLAVFGFFPPNSTSSLAYGAWYQWAEILLAVFLGGLLIFLLTRGGYQGVQRWLTGLMVLMLVCFLVVSFRGLAEWRSILLGLWPTTPPDLVLPGTGEIRGSLTSIVAIAGGTLAPASLLGYAYLSWDNGNQVDDFPREFRKAILNLGVLFGLYSILVMIAGGYALYPLAEHGSIVEVQQAGHVLTRAFPDSVSWLAPRVFSAGLFAAGLTTFVVIAQIMSYFVLDAFGQDWACRRDNRGFWMVRSGWVAVSALLAPLWVFPALLKVILLMGVNLLVVPLATAIILYFVNLRDLMGEYRASRWRNFWLVFSLLLSLWLAVQQAPRHWSLLFG